MIRCQPEERAAFGARHPENFINAIRSIEEFPDSDRLSLDELLHQNATVLEKLLGDGSFVLEPQPGIFVYQLYVVETICKRRSLPKCHCLIIALG